MSKKNMSALDVYIAKAKTKKSHGSRTPFELFDFYKDERRRECDDCISITTDSIGAHWGYWDFANGIRLHNEYCEQFGFAQIDFYKLVFPYITDGPFAMIPLDAADELIEQIDRFLAEFGQRLEGNQPCG